MIVSNITVPLVSLTDSAVAGHLASASQLAAVAIGSTIYQVPVLICAFLRMGTVGFTAQEFGRGDGSAIRRVLLQSLLVAVFLAFILLVLAYPLLPAALDLMHAGSELRPLASGYLQWRLLGLPAAAASYALTGWYLGAQDARITVRILIATNLLNIVLNISFVFGLGWGVQGIAAASVLAEWIGVGLGFAHLRHPLRRLAGTLDLTSLASFRHWRPLLAVHRDILARSLLLQGVFLALTVLGTRLGTDVVAANALLLNGLMLVAFALDGLANAVESLAGHAIGAHRPDGLRRVLVVAAGWSLLGALAFAVLFVLAGHAFIDIQTRMQSVRHVAYAFLPYLALLPLAAFPAYLLDGLFVAATRGRDMRNAMLASAVVFALLAFMLHGLGNHGLWIAFLGFMLTRAAIMSAMARRGMVGRAFASTLS